MRRYDNLSGDSGVAASEIRRGAIVVAFVNGSAYLYTDASAGVAPIIEMQRLAEAGRGLSTFISERSRGMQNGWLRPTSRKFKQCIILVRSSHHYCAVLSTIHRNPLKQND